MKVGFMIIGAMKCGTTSLAHMLALHPDISLSKPKEPQFFSNYPDWRNRLDEYHSKFPKEAKLYGEGSTNYTKYPSFRLNIWNDVYEYNKDMKFIYIVRDPIERIISHYVHLYEMGFTDYPIDEAVNRVPELINTSRYYTQIAPFIRKFGREQVHITTLDHLTNAPDETLREMFQFLGLDAIDLSHVDLRNFHYNKSYQNAKRHYKRRGKGLKYKLMKKVFPKMTTKLLDNSGRHFTSKPKLSQQSIELISNLLEADVLMLQDLLALDLSAWEHRKRLPVTAPSPSEKLSS